MALVDNSCTPDDFCKSTSVQYDLKLFPTFVLFILVMALCLEKHFNTNVLTNVLTKRTNKSTKLKLHMFLFSYYKKSILVEQRKFVYIIVCSLSLSLSFLFSMFNCVLHLYNVSFLYYEKYF